MGPLSLLFSSLQLKNLQTNRSPVDETHPPRWCTRQTIRAVKKNPSSQSASRSKEILRTVCLQSRAMDPEARWNRPINPARPLPPHSANQSRSLNSPAHTRHAPPDKQPPSLARSCLDWPRLAAGSGSCTVAGCHRSRSRGARRAGCAEPQEPVV